MIELIIRNPVKKISKKLTFDRRKKNVFKFPIKMSFLVTFQNYRREFANSSILNFILKNFWFNCFRWTYYLAQYNEVKRVILWQQNWIWRHISSDIIFIKKINRKFFCLNFPIQWAIGDNFENLTKRTFQWKIENRNNLCVDRKIYFLKKIRRISHKWW